MANEKIVSLYLNLKGGIEHEKNSGSRCIFCVFCNAD